MTQYRKKPVIIEAVKFTYPPTKELLEFCPVISGIKRGCDIDGYASAKIKTLEDGADGQCEHIATEGDYIIKGVNGEFYPCKPDIFQKTYELV